MYLTMYDRDMARMVRKQVYIEERQERLLKRRAKQLGVTEAELIRQGIDELDRRAPADPGPRRLEALADSERYIRARRLPSVPQTGRRWTREELYEERLARYGPLRH